MVVGPRDTIVTSRNGQADICLGSLADWIAMSMKSFTCPVESLSLDRRQWLVGVATASALCAGPFGVRHSVQAAAVYAGLNSDRYLGKVKVETAIEDRKVFLEGPAVDRAGIVYFTNVPMSKILRWDPQNRKLAVFRDHSHETNGLYFDRTGRLLCCEGGMGRVTRTTMTTGEVEVLVESYQGRKFAKPNDLCVDAQGRVYFTSRSAVEDLPGENPKGVYRIDTDGQVQPVLQWPQVHMPNGIVLAPDGKTLYLIEAHPDAEHHRDVRAYDVKPDGALVNERIHINFYPGRSGDGMCIDAEGNLYIAAGLHKLRGTSETLDTRPGIHVVSPRGELVAFRETPEDTITNCAFGGPDLRTLYITCGSKLVSLRTDVPGKPSYRPGG